MTANEAKELTHSNATKGIEAIYKCIRISAEEGYYTVHWYHGMSKGIITTLEENGYEVCDLSRHGNIWYSISWG